MPLQPYIWLNLNDSSDLLFGDHNEARPFAKLCDLTAVKYNLINLHTLIAPGTIMPLSFTCHNFSVCEISQPTIIRFKIYEGFFYLQVINFQ